MVSRYDGRLLCHLVVAQYWASVADGGITLKQQQLNVTRLVQVDAFVVIVGLKVIYHPLYGMNNYVLIWGDWLSCDPLRGSHDSQSHHIRKHLCPILIYLSQIYSYYIRGDRSPLTSAMLDKNMSTVVAAELS